MCALKSPEFDCPGLLVQKFEERFQHCNDTCITREIYSMDPQETRGLRNQRGDARDALLDVLQDLPPSAKLVVKTLEYEDALTLQELIAETRLPPRTLRNAVTNLETYDIITSRRSAVDARQKIYYLHPDLQKTTDCANRQ